MELYFYPAHYGPLRSRNVVLPKSVFYNGGEMADNGGETGGFITGLTQCDVRISDLAQPDTTVWLVHRDTFLPLVGLFANSLIRFRFFDYPSQTPPINPPKTPPLF